MENRGTQKTMVGVEGGLVLQYQCQELFGLSAELRKRGILSEHEESTGIPTFQDPYSCIMHYSGCSVALGQVNWERMFIVSGSYQSLGREPLTDS